MTDAGRPATAQEYVLAHLRQAIISRELEPGAAIRQDALAERLGTSRVPLREALKILEGEGQVVYHPHRGYFVAELSIADLLEVYRIRELLEAEAVRAAVPRIDDEELALIKAALKRTEAAGKAGDITELTTANREFHFRIFEASELPRLVRMIRLLWDSTDAYRSVYFAEPKNRREVDAEHRAILKALEAKQVKQVVSLLHAHRSHAVERLRELLD